MCNQTGYVIDVVCIKGYILKWQISLGGFVVPLQQQQWTMFAEHRVTPSTKKIVITFFWDGYDVIPFEILEVGHITNSTILLSTVKVLTNLEMQFSGNDQQELLRGLFFFFTTQQTQPDAASHIAQVT